MNYRLDAGLQFAMDRRKFLKLTGGGLAVAFVLHDLFSFEDETLATEHQGFP